MAPLKADVIKIKPCEWTVTNSQAPIPGKGSQRKAPAGPFTTRAYHYVKSGSQPPGKFPSSRTQNLHQSFEISYVLLVRKVQDRAKYSHMR